MEELKKSVDLGAANKNEVIQSYYAVWNGRSNLSQYW